MKPIFLNISSGRKRFKNNLGNANHLIITSLVGLDAIERGIIIDIPSKMRMTWSPRSAIDSARRSRRLILDMSFVRAIDGIDVYINDAMRKPELIQNKLLTNQLDSANRSVFKKLLAIETHFPELDSLIFAIISVFISWRNQGAHVEADDTILDKHREILKQNADEISERFSGLNVDMLLADYERSELPTFKEVASFINVAHHFVQNLEEQMFVSLNREQFLKRFVGAAINSQVTVTSHRDKARNKYVAQIWGRDEADRERYVRSFLTRKGLSNIASKHGPYVKFGSEVVNQLIRMKPREVNGWLESE